MTKHAKHPKSSLKTHGRKYHRRKARSSGDRGFGAAIARATGEMGHLRGY